MKKQTLLLAIVISSLHYAYGQEKTIDMEKWADKPTINTIDAKYNKESAVIITDKRRVEYADGPKDEVLEYYTLHKIIHINDDRGIESFNKIYLGFSDNADIVDVKARTILPGGKIIELDKNNIKDIKESDGNVYKIFAMEGLEKGCDIEYFYTYKKPASYFGREVLQSSFPVVESTFQLICPPRLRFDIKPYNFTASSTDTVLNEKRTAQCSLSGTPGAEEEKYAYPEAYLRRVEYKLSYNDAARKGERLFTWNELAKRIYSIYTYYTEKETKQIAELVKQNGWDALPDVPAKIIAVENYVKKNFSYDEELRDDDANLLAKVLEKKIAGTNGTARLYSAIFQSMAINFQFVLTGDRSKFIIDRTFENWNNCDFPVLYFPSENKYLAPTRPDYRYPWIFPAWGETYGLFCKHTSLGSFSTAIGEVKTIKLEDYTKSLQNIESKLELSSGLDSLSIDARQIFTGYPSLSIRDAFNFSNDEQKRLIVKELAKSVTSSENIVFSEILNKELENENNNIPLVLHVKTKSGELIERAGNKLLLKIGLAIGTQVEMYQEKPRQEAVDIEYGHIEERKIDFVIPDGYTIKNAGDLKIEQTFTDNGELTMGFVSTYEIKGNLLSVHIIEQYRKTFYPLSQFDQFRKIINASSDFNKVVLVLEKKG